MMQLRDRPGDSIGVPYYKLSECQEFTLVSARHAQSSQLRELSFVPDTM